ncbi:MAG TPA: hypothetical protein VID72_12695 [Ktedonobacterales bacterium]
MSISVRIPDHKEFQRSRWYNAYCANLLVIAYGCVNDTFPVPDRLERALALATTCLHQIMAAPQRLRAYWVLAEGYKARGDDNAALQAIEDALTIAYNQRDDFVISELLAESGQLHFQGLRIRKASDAFSASLYHRQFFGAMPDESGRYFEAHINRQLATLRMLLADPVEAEWRLAFARQILPDWPSYRLERLAIEQAQANLYRLSGHPVWGFDLATQAAEAYLDTGEFASASRLHQFVAELALDSAETAADNDKRTLYAQIASSHLAVAQSVSAHGGDEPAALMAITTQARRDRLVQPAPRSRADLLYVVRRATQLHDAALQAQALKVLAEEYTAIGEIESARACHRLTLAALSDTDLPALGVWAIRALA